MEIYETEEERLEALKKWWKEHGGSVLIGLALGALVVVSWNIWQRSQVQRQQQASAIYQQLLGAMKKDDREASGKLAERLATQYPSSAYGMFGKLFQAKLKVLAKDYPGARGILEDVMKNSKDPVYRLLARWRVGRLMIAQGEYEAAIKLLSDVGSSGAGGFEGLLEEAKGDAYTALNRLDEARTSYERAKANHVRSQALDWKLLEAGGTVDQPAEAEAVTQ